MIKITPPHSTKVWVTKVCIRFAIYLLLLINIPFNSSAQTLEPIQECPRALIHNLMIGDYDVAKILLEYSDIDINASLHHCGRGHFVPIVGMANEFEWVMYLEGSTLLHMVAYETQSVIMFRLLLSYGANPNLPDSDGITPLKIMYPILTGEGKLTYLRHVPF